MEKEEKVRHRIKTTFWRPNTHEDFTVYKCPGGYCVSIQYLGEWKYPTVEAAEADIPALKQYRNSVLRQIEIANEKYFKKQEIAERLLRAQLKSAKNIKQKRYGTTHLTNGQRRALIHMIKNGADEIACKEKYDISTHVYARLKQIYGEQNATIQPNASERESA